MGLGDGGVRGAGDCNGGGVEAGGFLEPFQHLGELRQRSRRHTGACISSFPTRLAVTQALLSPRQLSGDTDRIFPRVSGGGREGVKAPKQPI